METNFDPNEFMSQTVDTPVEGLQTEMKLVPEGEYRAMIDDFDHTAFERIEFTYKRGPNAGMPGSMTKFSIPFKITDDPKIKEALDRDNATVRKQLILDFDQNGKLDFGTNRNLELNRVRAAVGQDAAGVPWTFMDLRGKGPVMIKVIHREVERADGTKTKFAEVERVVRIS